MIDPIEIEGHVLSLRQGSDCSFPQFFSGQPISGAPDHDDLLLEVVLSLRPGGPLAMRIRTSNVPIGAIVRHPRNLSIAGWTWRRSAKSGRSRNRDTKPPGHNRSRNLYRPKPRFQ
jgi:hypothetical protein